MAEKNGMESMARIARFDTCGAPADVVVLRKVPLSAPVEGEVLIRMRCAPINPADLNFIEGRYGKKPVLPAVAGLEGVGEIAAVGPGVTPLPEGSLVRLPEGVGTWRSTAVARAEDCQVFPLGLTPEQAAMLYINPATAWRMLHDFKTLQPGDWVVQNAANSAVGRCVIQLAKVLGLRTLNLVRRAELAGELHHLGADVVVEDGLSAAKKAAALIGGSRPKLALNAVGGESALQLLKLLGPGGVQVTYGAMGRQPVTVPNGFLIFSDLTIRGFWVTQWYQRATKAESHAMLRHLADLMREGKLVIPVAASYPLSQVVEAVRHAQQEQRGGKILLDLQK